MTSLGTSTPDPSRIRTVAGTKRLRPRYGPGSRAAAALPYCSPWGGSVADHASGDDQRLARDVVGVRRGQEQVGLRHVLGLPGVAEGNHHHGQVPDPFRDAEVRVLRLLLRS